MVERCAADLFFPVKNSANRMNKKKASKRLILMVFTLTALLIFVSITGIIGIYKSGESLKSVYVNRTLPMWQLSEIQRLLQRTALIFSIGSNQKDPRFISTYMDEIERNLSDAIRLYDSYLQAEKTPEEVELSGNLKRSLDEIQTRGLRPAADAIKVFNFKEVARIQKEILIPLSEPARIELNRLTKLQLDVSNQEYDHAVKRNDFLRLVAILILAFGVIFAVTVGSYLAHSIMQATKDFEDSLTAKQDLERQLQHSQKVQALGQLTSGIAHDFNNILATILGYANLSLNRQTHDKNSKLANYLGEIIKSGERARELIMRMLAFARTVPSNDVALVTPSEAMHEVHAMLSHSIPSNIALTITVVDDLQVLISAGELQQMLVNLVINSRDAILESGVHAGSINIRSCRVDVENQETYPSLTRVSGSFFCIEVSDNGTGIAADVVPRIFDPFFTTKEVGKGTGLGLAMVQGIMARASGHILLQSNPGHGSKFQLLFPIAKFNNISTISSRFDEILPMGSGQLIFIVDDEPGMIGFMAELLSNQGFRCREFNDPKLALIAFQEGVSDVDAVVTDLTMPSMSGVDLVRELRLLKPGLPAIICTGFAKDGNPDVSLLGDEFIVLNKPFSNFDLATTLAGVLKI